MNQKACQIVYAKYVTDTGSILKVHPRAPRVILCSFAIEGARQESVKWKLHASVNTLDSTRQESFLGGW